VQQRFRTAVRDFLGWLLLGNGHSASCLATLKLGLLSRKDLPSQLHPLGTINDFAKGTQRFEIVINIINTTMEPPPLKPPATPAMPLFPLSPERVNGTRPPYDGKVPLSPSQSEMNKGGIDPSIFFSSSTSTPPRHSRNHSEVHVGGMVARFDALSIKDYKQRDEIAIKRVEMAREMAELERDRLKGEVKEWQDDAKKYRDEAKRTKRELDDTKERERKVTKRLDVVMEELQRAKENHNLAVGIYEKEIRRTKKDAFKSGSGMVKLQEELKAARASLNVVRANLETEKARSARKEQDSFTAQYQLVGLQEELQKLQERLKVVEEERDALKTNIKEEEIDRIAAEGQIALPTEEDDDDLLASPMKSPRKPTPSEGEDKENIMPKHKGQQSELKALQEELLLERQMRERAEDQVDFMKMECQFRCCSCRLAESQGTHYIHDNSFDTDMERIKQSVPRMGVLEDDYMDVDMDKTLVPESQSNSQGRGNSQTTHVELSKRKSLEFDMGADIVAKLPNVRKIEEMTMETANEERAEEQSDIVEQVVVIEDDFEDEEPFSTPPESATEPIGQIQPPHTPTQREFRTITTTTTIPIHFNSPFISSDSHQPTTPMTIGHPPVPQTLASPFPSRAFRPDGTLDREAALEQIRQRRGRARSVAMGYATPQKQMMEGIGPNGRRDISAPALRA